MSGGRTDRDRRIAGILAQLTLADKVGLMFQVAVEVGPGGALVEEPSAFLDVGTSALIRDRRITHVNVASAASPADIAAWVNALQRVALAEGRVPVTVSTDPRHSFRRTPGVAFAADGFSEWPESLGFAAIGDVATVRDFAATVREEYRAVGIRAALHPQIDLPTEPRWGRQVQTWGVDRDRVDSFLAASLEELQRRDGDAVGVACTVKHFPGGGPQRGGEDPHFPYGREQDYPAEAFEEHLEPFRRAIACGAAAMMPYYGMPVGLVRGGEPIEQVGFGFNRQMIRGVLRDELGFDGVVVTDWGLLTDDVVGDRVLPARAWGVEALSVEERMRKALDAGVDQFGGEHETATLLALVDRGLVSEERIDESAARLIGVKLDLGLFDDPWVDESRVAERVGTPEARAAGRRAQSDSVVVAAVGDAARGFVPLPEGCAVFLVGVDAEVAGGYARVVGDPADADAVLWRTDAPWEPRDHYFFERGFHAGSLAFPDETIDRLRAYAAHAPVVADVFLDRPALLGQLAPFVDTLTVTFGCSDAAYLDVLFGRVPARGTLPVDIPASMDQVLRHPTDSLLPLPGAFLPRGAGFTTDTTDTTDTKDA
ncbi:MULTISPECIES: glycoside hydrolase family 3 protein [unclassified Microbacterium]|uniref:glycoside hydrolase family 3 protein n=1 Tax=unclassified Microbacterium TaxID=2609290 RepID=UPI0030194775